MRNAPPYARRFYHWAMGVIGLVLVSSLLLLAVNHRLGLIVVLVEFTALIAWWITIGLWESSLLRRLEEAHGTLCTSCGYRLENLGEQGKCPECGAAFERAAVVSVWERYRPAIITSWWEHDEPKQ